MDSHKNNPARADVTTMGTTITLRSSDLNFEYSNEFNYSFPKNEPRLFKYQAVEDTVRVERQFLERERLEGFEE
jgi:hypothetical protein